MGRPPATALEAAASAVSSPHWKEKTQLRWQVWIYLVLPGHPWYTFTQATWGHSKAGSAH